MQNNLKIQTHTHGRCTLPNQIGLYLQYLSYASMAVLWMWIAKMLDDLRVRRYFEVDHEICQNSNLAIGLRRAGLYIGIALGMAGPLLWRGERTFLGDLKALAWEGLLVTVFLYVAQVVNDKLVLHHFDNSEAVGKGNVAVGLSEFGSYVATGLIALGTFLGEGGGLTAAFVFFILGQLALVIFVWTHEVISRYSLIRETKHGNVAAGTMLGMITVALGIILMKSVSGDFQGWTHSIQGFSQAALIGTVTLLLLQKPVDLLFLKRDTNLEIEIRRDQNTSAVLVAAGIRCGVAIIVAASIV